MRRTGILALAAILSGCSARPQHPSPYVPPETQYSAASTLMAAGGLMGAAVGADLAQDPRASKTQKAAGNAAMGAGLGLAATSLIDAIEVKRQREMFFDITRAFYHHYFGPPPVGESEIDRPAPPPVPVVPFNFKDPSDDEDP